MEQLKNIEQCLISQVQAQMGDLKKVNAKELGEVMDMIKDLEEAMYYCSIIEAMDKSKEDNQQPPMNISYYMEGDHGNGNSGTNSNRGNYYYSDQPRNSDGQFMTKNYVPYMEYAPYMMRDSKWRENHLPMNYYSDDSNSGRSSYSRRMYMENKKNGDDQKAMKELDHYMKDLADDMVEMIEKSTPEEKQILSNKLSQLAARVIK